MLYDATVIVGAEVTSRPIAVGPVWFLNVEVRDAEGIILNELAARFDDVAHQAREDLVGDIGLRDFDAEQRAVRRIERRFPQLLGVHFAKTLVALDRETLSARGKHGVEQLGRTRDRYGLALGFGLDGLGRFFALFTPLDFARGERIFLLSGRTALLQGAEGQRG